MAVVPALPTITSTTIWTSSQQSQVNAVIAYLLAPPIAELTQTAGGQSIATSTWTAVTFETETVDTAGGHSTSSNTSRYTAVYAGWYLCSGGVGLAANATGIRATAYMVNGNLIGNSTASVPGNATAVVVGARAKLIYLNVGDYVELGVWQNSGGALTTLASPAQDRSGMTVAWKSN